MLRDWFSLIRQGKINLPRIPRHEFWTPRKSVV
jgi:hypothetical protein